jgi:hypothetical protein
MLSSIWRIFAMSDFDYSPEALNAKSAFLRVDSIVYVEGEDDVPFWHEVFSNVSGFKFEIEPRGGANELDKYICFIENGELDAIAARDADYLPFCGKISKSPKIVYTIGYSIENTLYTTNSIHALAKQWCKAPTLPLDACTNWLHDFASKIAPLVAQDIANAKSYTGLNVLHDNCSQFMRSKISCYPCAETIQKKFNEIRVKLPEEALNQATTAVGGNTEKIIQTIRGHFLASAVARFISKQAQTLDRKVSLSGDGLYTSAMTYLSGCFKEDHPHYNHYMKSANKARDALAVSGGDV